MCIYRRTHMYICMYIYIYTHIHTYTCTCVYDLLSFIDYISRSLKILVVSV